MSPVDFYGKQFSSRLLIGTALYPSPAIMQQAIRASGAEIVTVSLRRESSGGRIGNAFWDLIRELGVGVLPNTAGCRSVREAVTTAELARELFETPWIKLEVIGDDETLQPDLVGLVEAAAVLAIVGGAFAAWAAVSPDTLPSSGALMLAALVVTLFGGLPIGFVLVLAALVYVMMEGSMPGVIVAQQMARGIDSFVMLAIPFFIQTAGPLVATLGAEGSA